MNFFYFSIFFNSTSTFFIFPKTDVMFALIRLHNDIMPLLVAITVFLVYMILWCLHFGVFASEKTPANITALAPSVARSNITHHSLLEII